MAEEYEVIRQKYPFLRDTIMLAFRGGIEPRVFESLVVKAGIDSEEKANYFSNLYGEVSEQLKSSITEGESLQQRKFKNLLEEGLTSSEAMQYMNNHG